MPIKRLQQSAASFPIIGKLRKGDKKPNGNQPGKDLEYFRFDTDDADAMKKFSEAYGNEPKAITVYLPFHTIEENFTSWQEEYSAGGLKHRCDGETCVIWQKPDGKYSHEPKPCPGGCKAVGRLTVIIPELMRFAYVSVETHSINDIMQLDRNLLAAFAPTGDLAGIPFLLIRRLVSISTPSGDGGKRVRRSKALLFLEPHPEWVQVKLLEMRRSYAGELMGATAPKQLTASPVVDDETGEIIDGDIYEDLDENDNPFDGAPRQSPAIDRLVSVIDKLFGADAANATTYVVTGWTKKVSKGQNVRSTIVELSDDECDAISDALTVNGEPVKAKYEADKKLAAESGATSGK